MAKWRKMKKNCVHLSKSLSLKACKFWNQRSTMTKACTFSSNQKSSFFFKKLFPNFCCFNSIDVVVRLSLILFAEIAAVFADEINKLKLIVVNKKFCTVTSIKKCYYYRTYIINKQNSDSQ